MKKIKDINELRKLKQGIVSARDQEKACVAICSSTGCAASGARKLVEAFKEEFKKQKLGHKIDVRTTGCHGFCERGPLMVIYPQKILYQKVTVADVPEILSKTLIEKKIIDRLLYLDPKTGEKIVFENEVPFYKEQTRLILGNNGLIDPTNIEDYLALNGYGALAKVFSQMTPVEVIEQIKKSGLRGRGGGGFPTGRKWESCRNAVSRAPDTEQRAYIICNADEGDPGCFQDRSLLEGNPHSILEGMVIGAYALGAHQGYVYVRNEYPLAVKHVGLAIEQAKEYGFLGENILNSGFSFNIYINRGGGAFVCGESSALIASLEGKVGEPRPKHTHATEKGLWDKPTVVNNVKTWASVPLIINRGYEWYSKIGTEKSKGTMVFSLVGKINNTGLVEVPMGISLRELIYDIGGGIPEGKKFKAVQTGGPSGGCIPESLIDLQVDYEKLIEAGSMMGSGGMIVMDDSTCMVNVAKYFLDFTKEESCGKCTPCREGVQEMGEVLCRITEGKGQKGDLDLLEELSNYVTKSSLCALGKSAPNPVLTTLRYFQDEYEAHIKEKRCPAGVCKSLIEYYIDSQKCTGCMLCLNVCPQKAIEGGRKIPHKIVKSKCNRCGICFETCKKFKAVIIR